MTLSSGHKKQLRKPGHHLHPVVMVGDQGLKETIIEATREALTAHELIKIKVKVADRNDRNAVIAALCEKTGADLVGITGFTALLFKRNRDKPRIELS